MAMLLVLAMAMLYTKSAAMMDAAGGGKPPDDGNWNMKRNLTYFIYMLGFIFVDCKLRKKKV